jgi:hypothetical protein
MRLLKCTLEAPTATAMTTTAMYPNNDTLGERLRLSVEKNFHDA